VGVGMTFAWNAKQVRVSFDRILP